jgi:hypothetical protein
VHTTVAKLKAAVATIDQVPEPLRPLYGQDGDRFVLQVDPVDGYALENVTGLKSALEGEKEVARKRAERLASFEGLDAAAARAALDKVKALGDIDPEKEADRLAAAKFEELKGQLLKTHATEMETRQAESQKLLGEVERLLIDNEALRAIESAEGVATLLLPHVKAMTRVRREGERFVVEVIDPKKGHARVDGKGDPMTIAALVEEMKAHDDFGRAFKGSGASGSGAGGASARPSGGGGAGSPKHRNDFANAQTKAEWIGKNGLTAFEALPQAPRA